MSSVSYGQKCYYDNTSLSGPKVPNRLTVGKTQPGNALAREKPKKD